MYISKLSILIDENLPRNIRFYELDFKRFCSIRKITGFLFRLNAQNLNLVENYSYEHKDELQ